MKLSELALANIEAFAREELPDVKIVCREGLSGMCQYCHRYNTYSPSYGWEYAYEYIKSGDSEDWYSGSCDSGGSFPA